MHRAGTVNVVGDLIQTELIWAPFSDTYSELFQIHRNVCFLTSDSIKLYHLSVLLQFA